MSHIGNTTAVTIRKVQLPRNSCSTKLCSTAFLKESDRAVNVIALPLKKRLAAEPKTSIDMGWTRSKINIMMQRPNLKATEIKLCIQRFSARNYTLARYFLAGTENDKTTRCRIFLKLIYRYFFSFVSVLPLYSNYNIGTLKDKLHFQLSKTLEPEKIRRTSVQCPIWKQLM